MATRTLKTTGGPYTWDNSDVSAWQEGAVPVAGDDVVFPSCATNVTLGANVPATGSLASFVCASDYTGTFARSTYTISVGGAVTLASSMANTGTGAMLCTASGTLTFRGSTWSGGWTLGGASQTYTLGDAGACTGLLTYGQTGGTLCTVSGYGFTVAGGVTYACNTEQSGGHTLTMTGGTLTRGAGHLWLTSLTFAGNVTIGNTQFWKNMNITRASGTVTTGSNLNIGGAFTMNTPGMTWVDMITDGATTITNNAALAITGVNIKNSNLAFVGTTAPTIGTLQTGTTTFTAARTLTLKAGLTYTISTAFNVTHSTSNFHLLVQSDTADVQADIVLNGTQNVNYCDATDVDASGGTTIVSPVGTFDNSPGWSNGGNDGSITFTQVLSP